ncbi:MAG: DUF362 domain-containing protein [Candidatus Cloacimonetes bacterium]|nr:DUF362 domain-containing protein [Candidatus Cloacimonadota bacterium]
MDTNDLFFRKLPPVSSIAERRQALAIILEQLDFERIIKPLDKVAIKTHFGDVNNTTHISPALVKMVVEKIESCQGLPFLTETSTLYSGPRNNAVTHLQHAYSHGFTYEQVGAPIIMADGLLGNSEIEVAIPGILYKKVKIARDAILADSLVLLSHPTGHLATGIGAALKNLGMGLSSRKGKLQQHSSIKPYINNSKCTFCEQCLKWCPEQAIIPREGVAFIISEKCSGCGECLAVCKFNAVKYNWGVQSEDIQQRIAEYALGAVIGKREKCVFINVLADMTRQCDCMNIKQKPVIGDIGILGGYDPVALDQATLDLTRRNTGKDLGAMSFPELDPNVQLSHAEKIGLGKRKYKLTEL